MVARYLLISADTLSIDGVKSPAAPCSAIIVAINAAVKVLLTIDVNVSVYGDLCASILSIILDILVVSSYY